MMGNYVLDYGPIVSGTPSFTVFRDSSTGADYIDDAPVLNELISGWTQFTWSSGVNIHFRAEVNNNAWIAGSLSNVDVLPIGDGAVSVDHDYGGADNLRVISLDTGVPVNNAFVTFYLTEDYSAGRVSPNLYAKAWVYTLNDGRFENPVFLDPGSYTLKITASDANVSNKVIVVS